MKILYVLSGFGQGSGGHVHSLSNIANALDGFQGLDIKIASIGNVESPVLLQNDKFLGNQFFKWYSFFTLNKKFKALLKDRQVDIVHCYDGGTALLLMMLPVFWKTRIVHTKCGGPNERNYFAQFLQTVILFSEENLASFQKNPRFKTSDIYLLPNRVPISLPKPDAGSLLKKEPGIFTLMRICRIGKTYKDSIFQAIALTKALSESGLTVKLIVIGVVDDMDSFGEIKAVAVQDKVPVSFYTDRAYTSEASRFLYAADAVVGTGRGAMEAMALGLPVFSPLLNRKLPAFVNADTFGPLFSNNFSGRTRIDQLSDQEILAHSTRLVREPDFYENASQESRRLGEKHFLITDEVRQTYSGIYQKVMGQKRVPLISRNIIPILYYINTYRRVSNRQRKN